jgi:Flp pilus assembly CpaF family ATPase
MLPECFLSSRSVREAIAFAVHLVVHIARINGARRVTEVARVTGYDVGVDRFVLETPALVVAPEGGIPA